MIIYQLNCFLVDKYSIFYQLNRNLLMISHQFIFMWFLVGMSMDVVVMKFECIRESLSCNRPPINSSMEESECSEAHVK